MDPLTLDAPAPDFCLPDLGGQAQCLSGWRGQVAVLVFWSPECDWCRRTDQDLLDHLATWGAAVRVVWIASNDGESHANIGNVAAERSLPVVLIDTQHQVADLYRALVTPHIYVIDGEGCLRYQGAYDDVTFRQRTPARHYTVQAIEALLHGRSPDPAETPAYGCAILRLPG